MAHLLQFTPRANHECAAKYNVHAMYVLLHTRPKVRAHLTFKVPLGIKLRYLLPNCAYCARLGVSTFHWFLSARNLSLNFFGTDCAQVFDFSSCPNVRNMHGSVGSTDSRQQAVRLRGGGDGDGDGARQPGGTLARWRRQALATRTAGLDHRRLHPVEPPCCCVGVGMREGRVGTAGCALWSLLGWAAGQGCVHNGVDFSVLNTVSLFNLFAPPSPPALPRLASLSVALRKAVAPRDSDARQDSHSSDMTRPLAGT
eukprot:COSAG02_NODE_1279_length_13487_cov_7.611696_5_plen_256_part_00